MLKPSEKLIFLAGPIQGAPNWQEEAIEKFKALYHGMAISAHIANPRLKETEESFDDEAYKAQVDWEKKLLRRAAENGAVIFWFASQDTNVEYPYGRAYAQTSKLELGRVLGWKDYDHSLKLHVGIEPGYQGGNERYIRMAADDFNIPVIDNLKELTENTYIDLRRNR